MSRDYQPRQFLRHAPNYLLKRYFDQHGVLADLDFEPLTETNIEPIYMAWLALADEVRKPMEQDFQDIDALASEGGINAILDEAVFHGLDLAPPFAGLGSFNERAFWTLLEHPNCWDGALAFYHADSVGARSWRKRKNLPERPAAVDSGSIRLLEAGIGDYFHAKEGRGRNCKVDCYKRGDRDYFFAYPEDYAQADVEWGREGLKRQPRRPAFEIIFVYTQGERTLDLYTRGSKALVPKLQAIFADAILKAPLGQDEKNERVYDLNPVQSGEFQFTYPPESGIASVAVKKLRLAIHGGSDRIVLEADPTRNHRAVFDLRDQVAKGIPQSHMRITQVGLKVTFAHDPTLKRPPTRTFDVTWPNSRESPALREQ